MLDWLKQYLNYPLDIENIVSVRLSKGKNGIHLDNKEHAILEHCFNPDGKLAKTTLIIMLLLDAEYLKKATAHRAAVKAELEDKELVRFSLEVSISLILYFPQSHYEPISERAPSLLVSCTAAGLNSRLMSSQLSTHPRPYPKPRPIFGDSKGKKRKIVDIISSDSSSDSQDFDGNKRTRRSQGGLNSDSIVAPVAHIRKALIAQCEPQPAAISGLRMCTLTSMWLHVLTHYFSPHSIISDPIQVVSYQAAIIAYLSPTCH